VVTVDSSDRFPAWPQFGDELIAAAESVLRSGRVNYWTGQEGMQFEREFAEFTGCAHALAVANGTVALEAALRALGIGPGDEVITTSRTFIASAGAVVAVGARPVFVDVDPWSQTILVEAIGNAVTASTRAVLAVHLGGWPCDMPAILAAAQKHGLRVVEDCAQAQGATLHGRQVGSFGDIAAFSFCQDKIMTTAGEGGMVCTSDEQLWKRMWAYRDHGKDFDAMHSEPKSASFRWVHESFGSNLRMTEVQSAVGRVALRKVPEWAGLRLCEFHRCLDMWAMRITGSMRLCAASYWLRAIAATEFSRSLGRRAFHAAAEAAARFILKRHFQWSGVRPSVLPLHGGLAKAALRFLFIRRLASGIWSAFAMQWSWWWDGQRDTGPGVMELCRAMLRFSGL
jgi:dTDP-4-amino-4,6-dideoxygalactose transaminase